MDLIIFIVESILTMQITKFLFRNRIKTVHIFNKRWKYELVEAVVIISIIIVVVGMLGERCQIYFAGFVLGVVQGILEMILGYKKDE